MATPPSANGQEDKEREQHRLQDEILVLYGSHIEHKLGSDNIKCRNSFMKRRRAGIPKTFQFTMS
jgi:hypothetical protein